MIVPLRVTKEFFLPEDAVRTLLGLTQKQVILSITRPMLKDRWDMGFIVTVDDQELST